MSFCFFSCAKWNSKGSTMVSTEKSLGHRAFSDCGIRFVTRFQKRNTLSNAEGLCLQRFFRVCRARTAYSLYPASISSLHFPHLDSQKNGFPNSRFSLLDYPLLLHVSQISSLPLQTFVIALQRGYYSTSPGKVHTGFTAGSQGARDAQERNGLDGFHTCATDAAYFLACCSQPIGFMSSSKNFAKLG